jgi:hypothetical protein
MQVRVRALKVHAEEVAQVRVGVLMDGNAGTGRWG